MGKNFTLFILLVLGGLAANAQVFDEKHNPQLDFNLSPCHNMAINPGRNSSINPRLNWNINPFKNGLINPDKIAAINPKSNLALNPVENRELNPMYTINMSPKFERWHGLYIFDTTNSLLGYITNYSQDIMMQFDKDANWTYFYVKTARGTYNQFNLEAVWTGCFLCFDSVTGFNLFNKEGQWTGMHIK